VKRDARIELLSSVDLFRGCSKSELRHLASITTVVEVPAGTVLCREGEAGAECYIVATGEAVVSIDGEDIDRVGPGGFFGEMALLDGGPRVATVTAATDMELLNLSRRELSTALTAVPGLARKMLVAAGQRLRLAHAARRPARVGA